MTLDEAIKHAEEVADGHDRIKQIKAVTLEECKCASEHRQLAEWLKDYKRLKEQVSCEDCISRKAAIIQLSYNKIGNDDYEEIIQNDINTIKALPPVISKSNTEWIPVSEKLPKDEDYVLVCYEDGHIRTAYYYIDTNFYPSEFEDCCETGWYNYNKDFMYRQDVIAWMPLPEFYKVESENQK